MVKPQLRGGPTGGWEGRAGGGACPQGDQGASQEDGGGAAEERPAEGAGATRRPCGLCCQEAVRAGEARASAS